MKKTCALAVVAVLCVGDARAQEATPPAPPAPPAAPAQAAPPTPPAPPAPPRRATAMHVQIVVARAKAGKAISRLPYTVTCIADGAGRPATLRMGVEVPVAVGGGKGIQYRNVGLNIDTSCETIHTDDRYRVKIAVEQSSISDLGRAATTLRTTTTATGEESVEGNPMFRTFNSTFQALLRDGESALSTVATDPVTGDDVTIEATLKVLK